MYVSLKNLRGKAIKSISFELVKWQHWRVLDGSFATDVLHKFQKAIGFIV